MGPETGEQREGCPAPSRAPEPPCFLGQGEVHKALLAPTSLSHLPCHRLPLTVTHSCQQSQPAFPNLSAAPQTWAGNMGDTAWERARGNCDPPQKERLWLPADLGSGSKQGLWVCRHGPPLEGRPKLPQYPPISPLQAPVVPDVMGRVGNAGSTGTRWRITKLMD